MPANASRHWATENLDNKWEEPLQKRGTGRTTGMAPVLQGVLPLSEQYEAVVLGPRVGQGRNLISKQGH